MKKLYSWTLIYAFISAVHWTYEYILDWKNSHEFLHGDAFRLILKKYLRMNAKVDWLGRVYGIVNPNFDERGNIDFNNMVFEIDGINTNNNTWVENWLYKQMILVSNVFNLERTGLFDIVTSETRHVGPRDADNYLVIFDILSRKLMSKKWKRCIIQSIIYTIIGFIIFNCI